MSSKAFKKSIGSEVPGSSTRVYFLPSFEYIFATLCPRLFSAATSSSSIFSFNAVAASSFLSSKSLFPVTYPPLISKLQYSSSFVFNSFHLWLYPLSSSRSIKLCDSSSSIRLFPGLAFRASPGLSDIILSFSSFLSSTRSVSIRLRVFICRSSLLDCCPWALQSEFESGFRAHASRRLDVGGVEGNSICSCRGAGGWRSDDGSRWAERQ
mmetsp:Transcript_5271/g.12806  ORF Transcript_5271/g.12806 Transcript_5271/m.12806 type:complete len:210 (-) Transcript_5271:45-674(-)